MVQVRDIDFMAPVLSTPLVGMVGEGISPDGNHAYGYNFRGPVPRIAVAAGGSSLTLSGLSQFVHGTRIRESGAVPTSAALTAFQSVSGSAYRWDILACSYNRPLVIGGSAASYSTYRGTATSLPDSWASAVSTACPLVLAFTSSTAANLSQVSLYSVGNTQPLRRAALGCNAIEGYQVLARKSTAGDVHVNECCAVLGQIIPAPLEQYPVGYKRGIGVLGYVGNDDSLGYTYGTDPARIIPHTLATALYGYVGDDTEHGCALSLVNSKATSRYTWDGVGIHAYANNMQTTALLWHEQTLDSTYPASSGQVPCIMDLRMVALESTETHGIRTSLIPRSATTGSVKFIGHAIGLDWPTGPVPVEPTASYASLYGTVVYNTSAYTSEMVVRGHEVRFSTHSITGRVNIEGLHVDITAYSPASANHSSAFVAHGVAINVVQKFRTTPFVYGTNYLNFSLDPYNDGFGPYATGAEPHINTIFNTEIGTYVNSVNGKFIGVQAVLSHVDATMTPASESVAAIFASLHRINNTPSLNLLGAIVAEVANHTAPAFAGVAQSVAYRGSVTSGPVFLGYGGYYGASLNTKPAVGAYGLQVVASHSGVASSVFGVVATLPQDTGLDSAFTQAYAVYGSVPAVTTAGWTETDFYDGRVAGVFGLGKDGGYGLFGFTSWTGGWAVGVRPHLHLVGNNGASNAVAAKIGLGARPDSAYISIDTANEKLILVVGGTVKSLSFAA